MSKKITETTPSQQKILEDLLDDISHAYTPFIEKEIIRKKIKKMFRKQEIEIKKLENELFETFQSFNAAIQNSMNDSNNNK